MRSDSSKNKVPALFLHIQKTAGTSIVHAAAGHYGQNSICSHGDFVGKNPKDFESILFVSGHFGFDFAKDLLPGRYSFTFLRSPIERVLSFYYFCRTRDAQQLPIYRIAHEHDLDGFLNLATKNEIVRRGIWNSMTWRLASGPGPSQTQVDDLPPDAMLARALDHLDALSFVGFTETFDEDAALVVRQLGLPYDFKLSRVNVTPGRPLIKNHSSRTIRLIEEMTHLDQLLYDAALLRRKSNLEAGNAGATSD